LGHNVRNSIDVGINNSEQPSHDQSNGPSDRGNGAAVVECKEIGRNGEYRKLTMASNQPGQMLTRIWRQHRLD